MNQMELVTGFMKVLGEQKKLLKHTTINMLIKCVNELIAEEERPFMKAENVMGLEAWLKSDDTGLSSKYMAFVLCNGPKAEYAHPVDADDFGRCYRFLKAVLGGDELSVMAGESKQWQALVTNWPELSELYEKNKFVDLSKKIQELLKGVEK